MSDTIDCLDGLDCPYNQQRAVSHALQVQLSSEWQVSLRYVIVHASEPPISEPIAALLSQYGQLWRSQWKALVFYNLCMSYYQILKTLFARL